MEDMIAEGPHRPTRCLSRAGTDPWAPVCVLAYGHEGQHEGLAGGYGFERDRWD